MPELPEVEATRENLERWLSGKTVRAAKVLDRRMARGQDPRRLEAALCGAKVKGIARRAKYLILDLGRRGGVFTHLGMTGKFVLREAGEADPPAVRVALDLGGGRRVLFSDHRRFGRFQFLDGEAEALLQALGVEPLLPEFTPGLLAGLLGRSRLPVKPCLMDQGRIAGLGNIQAGEALFLAGIHPARRADGLSKEEVRRLHRAIVNSLKRTLRSARAPELTYLEEGGSENPFRVYDREGEPCPRCGTRLGRFTQAGRSSYFCRRCQPAPRGTTARREAAGGGAPGSRRR